MTDDTVILGILLSHLRDVNKSQSDGLTGLFFSGIRGNNVSFDDLFLLLFRLEKEAGSTT